MSDNILGDGCVLDKPPEKTSYVERLEDILTAFVELENSGLSCPERIAYQTKRARELLKLY